MSEAQITSLSSENPEAIAKVFFQLSQNIAFGIAHLILSERLPLPQGDKGFETGGVRILGWSAGNVFLLSLLANLGSLNPYVNALLERYVTSVIIDGEEFVPV